MHTVRWGIIGCGNVTEVKSGPGFQETPHSRLVHVMRRQGELARDYARRHDVPAWSDNAGTLIRDPQVDAVYVATPPGNHLDYALACAEAGKPCYVEKPMARNHDECVRMVAAFEAAKLPLFVAYYRRALPRFIRIKELLDSGTLGAIRHVHVTQDLMPEPEDNDPERRAWRLKPAISGGGRFLDLASHTLDVLDYLFGTIASVNGVAENLAGLYSPEDFVSGTFRFNSGLAASGDWCYCAGVNREYVEVIGERGLLRFSIFGNAPLELIHNTDTQSIDAPNPVHIQQPLIQTIVEELTGTGSCPSTGARASRTTWVMDRFLEGFRSEHASNPDACFIG